MRLILDRVRMTPRAVESSQCNQAEQSQEHEENGMKHCSLTRVTISECLVPNVKPSFFRFTDVEITEDDAHSVGIRKPPMWSDETQSFS